MRTPDGHGRVELTRFHAPPAVRAEPENTHAAELVGEIAQCQDSYRRCFVRGPEGCIVGLAEQLS
jgi:hypothetical protein